MLKIILTAFCFLLAACSVITSQKNKNLAIAEMNMKLALAYLEQNHIQQAKEKLLQAQQQASANPTIWYVSGYLLERMDDNNSANQAYLTAIQLAPTLGEAHNNYGAFLCRHGHYTQAITHFLLAVQDPHYSNIKKAYKNAALCAFKIPDNILAKKYLALSATG